MGATASTAGPRSPPARDVSKHMLRRSEQRLLEMVRRVGYGSLAGIPVRNGQLLLGQKIRTRSRHRLGRQDDSSGRLARADDFKLKRQHWDLICRVRRIIDGVVTIEIQDGLPINLLVDEDLAA